MDRENCSQTNHMHNFNITTYNGRYNYNAGSAVPFYLVIKRAVHFNLISNRVYYVQATGID